MAYYNIIGNFAPSKTPYFHYTIYSMKHILLFTGIIFLTINTYSQTTGDFSSQVSWSNNDGTQTRTLQVYVPSNYNASNEYALIIGFHGLGSSPTSYMYSNNSLRDMATDPYFGNLIVVTTSEGPNQVWLWTEDYGIIKAIKDEISANYNIDQDRVFAQGFSYGGKASYVHGLAEANEIKGIFCFSPAFYGEEDIYDTCVLPTCISTHQDLAYTNAPNVLLCSGAGTSERELTPLDQADFPTATLDDTFWGLANHVMLSHNDNGGNGIFIENTSTIQYQHSLPTMSIVKQCWDHVDQTITGISDIKEEEVSVFVYPQPSAGVFNLQFSKELSEATIEVYDLTGNKIKLLELIGNTNNSVKIDLSGNPTGIYLARIRYNNTVRTVKLNLLN